MFLLARLPQRIRKRSQISHHVKFSFIIHQNNHRKDKVGICQVKVSSKSSKSGPKFKPEKKDTLNPYSRLKMYAKRDTRLGGIFSKTKNVLPGPVILEEIKIWNRS